MDGALEIQFYVTFYIGLYDGLYLSFICNHGDLCQFDLSVLFHSKYLFMFENKGSNQRTKHISSCALSFAFSITNCGTFKTADSCLSSFNKSNQYFQFMRSKANAIVKREVKTFTKS